jgi:hypothetical protein
MNILVNKNIVFRINKTFYNIKNTNTEKQPENTEQFFASNPSIVFNIKNKTSYTNNIRNS